MNGMKYSLTHETNIINFNNKCPVKVVKIWKEAAANQLIFRALQTISFACI